ncbi:MAG: glycerol-3-phosphate acyltransferase [Opitutaceae bacterium]
MPIADTPPWVVTVLVVCAYLVGSLSPGWWLVRHYAGTDLRDEGSGATGATNAARVLGKRGYAYVLLLDALKGLFAVWAVRKLAPDAAWISLAGPAVVAGHIWPIFLGFRGGKGAATYMGACLVWNPWIVLVAWVPGLAAGIFFPKGFVVRSIAFLASLPIGWWLISDPPGRCSFILAWSLVLLAHRDHFAKPLVR